MKHAHWLLLAAFAAGNAVAQAGKRPDPADPNAKAPAQVYRSAFEGYRNLEEAKPTVWRDANDAAARIGGHIGILREQAAGERAKQGERK
jgi:hypothetical protein